jgi:cysteinyl-tRNA synthetase
MVSMIETLIQKGFAYASEGHVLFRTQRFTPYGRLSGQRQEEIMAGSRIEVESYKEHPSDFVLWKPSDDGDPFWSSPWGKGRPGWHIECSAMSHRWLGTTFDIHGGGIDLVFPHHENEIAQTCGAFDVSIMARYWLHNGHLMVHGKKMSKSLGNFMTVKDLLEHHDGEVVRFCLLHTHYRQPLDFHESMLAQGRNVLDRWYNALRGDEMDHHMDDAKPWEYDTPSPISKEFLSILCDDMNTPAAITWIHAQVDNLYQQRCPTARLALQKQIKACARMLGLLNLRPTQWFQQSKKTHDHSCLSDEDIAHLIQQRNDARNVRDFNTADAIRKKLAHQHITLEDTPSTTLWRRN